MAFEYWSGVFIRKSIIAEKKHLGWGGEFNLPTPSTDASLEILRQNPYAKEKTKKTRILSNFHE